MKAFLLVLTVSLELAAVAGSGALNAFTRNEELKPRIASAFEPLADGLPHVAASKRRTSLLNRQSESSSQYLNNNTQREMLVYIQHFQTAETT